MRMNLKRESGKVSLPKSPSTPVPTASVIARLVSIVAVFCLLTAGASAFAQTQEETPVRASRGRQLGMDELMQLADTVVYGRVAEVKSGWNDRRTVIYSTVTIAVDRTVKGRSTSTLSFQHIGGQVGNLRTRVSHFPEFSVGEDVLLFLNLAKPSKFSPLVRGNQGKYRVHRDDKTQTPYLGADSVRMPIFSAATRRPVAPERLQASGRVALDDVLYSLQRVTAPGRANRQRGGE